jgi:hypothetical protein
MSIGLFTSVPCESRHPSAANYPTVELAVLKEMSQELAELFGLTLPTLMKSVAIKRLESGYRDI